MLVCVKDYQSLIPSEFREWFSVDGVADCVASAEIQKDGLDPDRRRFRFIASDDSVDLDDEIIAAGAFHESRGIYLRRPSILAAHQHRLSNGFPGAIGKAVELQTEKNPVWGIGQFNNTTAGKEHAEAVFDGSESGVSVGFRSRERERREGRVVHVKADLLEISLVAVPCNPQAIICEFIGGRMADAARSTADTGLAKEAMAAVRELTEKVKHLEWLLDPAGGRPDDEGIFEPDPEEEKQILECLGHVARHSAAGFGQ